jgi:hypothetical protein
VESNSESKAAFLIGYDTDSGQSDVFGDVDWFDEVASQDTEMEDWFSEENTDELISSASDSDSLANQSPFDTLEVVLVAAETANPDDCRDTCTRAELYDSGCTKHITPYRDDIIDFVDFPSCKQTEF